MLDKTHSTAKNNIFSVTSSQGYHSYLVRIWRSGDEAYWRASITDVGTGESQTFVTVQAMFVYLHERLETAV